MESAWKWGTQRVSGVQQMKSRASVILGWRCHLPAGRRIHNLTGEGTTRRLGSFNIGGSCDYVGARITTGTIEAMGITWRWSIYFFKNIIKLLKSLGHPLTEKTGMRIARGRGSMSYLASVSPTA